MSISDVADWDRDPSIVLPRQTGATARTLLVAVAAHVRREPPGSPTACWRGVGATHEGRARIAIQIAVAETLAANGQDTRLAESMLSKLIDVQKTIEQ